MKKKIIVLILFILLLPAAVMAQDSDCPPGVPVGTVCLKNPLAAVGVNSPGDLVVRVIQLFSGIIATAAVMFMVFSGFKLVIGGSFAPGKDQKRNEAKESLIWAVGGFCVAILSFTIVSGAAKLLGFDPGIVGDNLSKDTLDSPLSGPADPRFFWSVVNFVMVNILALIGIVTIFMMIYYGYRYITAAGDEESITQAKSGLKWALAGFIISLLSYTIISSVQRLLLLGAPS